MSVELAELFADLDGLRGFDVEYGVVTSIGPLRVRLDSMDSGDIGPLSAVRSLPHVDDRVALLRVLATNEYVVIGRDACDAAGSLIVTYGSNRTDVFHQIDLDYASATIVPEASGQTRRQTNSFTFSGGVEQVEFAWTRLDGHEYGQFGGFFGGGPGASIWFYSVFRSDAVNLFSRQLGQFPPNTPDGSLLPYLVGYNDYGIPYPTAFLSPPNEQPSFMGGDSGASQRNVATSPDVHLLGGTWHVDTELRLWEDPPVYAQGFLTGTVRVTTFAVVAPDYYTFNVQAIPSPVGEQRIRMIGPVASSAQIGEAVHVLLYRPDAVLAHEFRWPLDFVFGDLTTSDFGLPAIGFGLGPMPGVWTARFWVRALNGPREFTIESYCVSDP